MATLSKRLLAHLVKMLQITVFQCVLIVNCVISNALLDPLVQYLSKFVAIPSVSNCEQNREDCRQAAIWLKRCMSQLGAEATMARITGIA